MHNYWSADYHDEFPDDAIDVFVKYGFERPVAVRAAAHVPWGGAVARVPEDATPMTKRDVPWIIAPVRGVGGRGRRRDKNIEWAKAFRRDIAHYANGGVYLNFIGDEGEDRVRAAYGDEKYRRLAADQGRMGPGQRVPRATRTSSRRKELRPGNGHTKSAFTSRNSSNP